MQMNSFIILLLLINYICFAFGLCYLVIFLYLDTCDDHIQVAVSKDSRDKRDLARWKQDLWQLYTKVTFLSFSVAIVCFFNTVPLHFY